MQLERRPAIHGQRDGRRDLPARADLRGVRGDLVLVLDVEVAEVVADAAAHLPCQRAIQKQIAVVDVGVVELAAREALQGVRGAAAHRGELVELVRGAAGERVAPRTIASDRDAGRGDEVGVRGGRIRVGQRECKALARPPHAVEVEVLRVERVVAGRVAQIELGREVVTRDEPVRAALPDQIDRRRDPGDQVPGAIVIVEQDVVVVLLAQRDRRQQGERCAQRQLQLLRILRGPLRGELRRDRHLLSERAPGHEAHGEHDADEEKAGDHAQTNITRRRAAGRAFWPRPCGVVRWLGGSA